MLFIVTAGAGAATGAIGSLGFRSGGDGKTALLRPIVDIVDYNAAKRPELLIQLGMNTDVDIVRLVCREFVVWLIQSQSQNGAASAVAHKTDKNHFAFGLFRLEDLGDLLTGGV